MPYQHFMLADLVSSTIVICIFPLVAFVPGYIFGWFTDVIGFRSQNQVWRGLISVPLSVALCPILAFWLDLLSGPVAVWGMLALCWITFTILALNHLRSWHFRKLRPSKELIEFGAMILLWVIVALGSLTDRQIGGRTAPVRGGRISEGMFLCQTRLLCVSQQT